MRNAEVTRVLQSLDYLVCNAIRSGLSLKYQINDWSNQFRFRRAVLTLLPLIRASQLRLVVSPRFSRVSVATQVTNSRGKRMYRSSTIHL
jgi:hypothetical protein